MALSWHKLRGRDERSVRRLRMVMGSPMILRQGDDLDPDLPPDW